jgi:hypothetical protein
MRVTHAETTVVYAAGAAQGIVLVAPTRSRPHQEAPGSTRRLRQPLVAPRALGRTTGPTLCCQVVDAAHDQDGTDHHQCDQRDGA